MHKTTLQVLKAIYSLFLEYGWWPTYREIGEAIGNRSISIVGHHIENLEKMCYIRRLPGSPRALDVTDEGIEAIALSFLSLADRAAIARGWLQGNHKLAAAWRLALDDAKHGRFDIIVEEEDVDG